MKATRDRLALLAEHALTRGLPVPVNGAGGASEVYVARAGQVLRSIRIADVLRPLEASRMRSRRCGRWGRKPSSAEWRHAGCHFIGWPRSRSGRSGGRVLPDQKAKWVTELRKGRKCRDGWGRHQRRSRFGRSERRELRWVRERTWPGKARM